jgi:hypothetical protein
MAWYALEEIDEAIDETKELIWPPDFWTWTKLAIIILFVGGGGFNLPSSFPSDTGSTGGELDQDFNFDSTTLPESSIQSPGSFDEVMSSMGASSAGLSNSMVLAIFALLVPVILIFMYIGSVFEFIFYKSLIDKKVNITGNFRENIWKGARYFGFQLVFLLAVLGLVASVFGSFMVSGALGLLMVLLFIPLLLVLSIFSGLTHDFVLLRMLEDDEKLVEAWKSFWPDLRTDWKQVGVYLIVKFFVSLVVGIASAIVILLATLVFAIPAIILVILSGMIAEVLMLVTGALMFLIWLIMLFYLAVPFRTYIYYYVILVYHDLTS